MNETWSISKSNDMDQVSSDDRVFFFKADKTSSKETVTEILGSIQSFHVYTSQLISIDHFLIHEKDFLEQFDIYIYIYI